MAWSCVAWQQVCLGAHHAGVPLRRPRRRRPAAVLHRRRSGQDRRAHQPRRGKKQTGLPHPRTGLNHNPECQGSTGAEPSTINHQPSTINHQPSTINHQPSTINQSVGRSSYSHVLRHAMRMSWNQTLPGARISDLPTSTRRDPHRNPARHHRRTGAPAGATGSA